MAKGEGEDEGEFGPKIKKINVDGKTPCAPQLARTKLNFVYLAYVEFNFGVCLDTPSWFYPITISADEGGISCHVVNETQYALHARRVERIWYQFCFLQEKSLVGITSLLDFTP